MGSDAWLGRKFRPKLGLLTACSVGREYLASFALIYQVDPKDTSSTCHQCTTVQLIYLAVGLALGSRLHCIHGPVAQSCLKGKHSSNRSSSLMDWKGKTTICFLKGSLLQPSDRLPSSVCSTTPVAANSIWRRNLEDQISPSI